MSIPGVTTILLWYNISLFCNILLSCRSLPFAVSFSQITRMVPAFSHQAATASRPSGMVHKNNFVLAWWDFAPKCRVCAEQHYFFPHPLSSAQIFHRMNAGDEVSVSRETTCDAVAAVCCCCSPIRVTAWLYNCSVFNSCAIPVHVSNFQDIMAYIRMNAVPSSHRYKDGLYSHWHTYGCAGQAVGLAVDADEHIMTRFLIPPKKRRAASLLRHRQRCWDGHGFLSISYPSMSTECADLLMVSEFQGSLWKQLKQSYRTILCIWITKAALKLSRFADFSWSGIAAVVFAFPDPGSRLPSLVFLVLCRWK